jgi:undecaprenyl-phosphate galactose phosphotransferase
MPDFHSAQNTAATDLNCDQADLPQTDAISNFHVDYHTSEGTLDEGDGTLGPLPARGGHTMPLRRASRRGIDLPTQSLGYRLGKRVFDLVLAVAIAPVVGILIVMIGGVLLVCCGRPVFFRQRRIGQHGRPFGIWKFRTMHNDAEQIFAHHLFRDADARHEWNTTHKLRDDPRTTPLGDFLRRTSLDELPQLFNILLGDMSFVGPRPIVNAEVVKYGDGFSYYLEAVPGMTGLWQVSGRCNVGYKARVILDSNYVCNWTFWGDMKILLRTPKVVFRRDGAY